MITKLSENLKNWWPYVPIIVAAAAGFLTHLLPAEYYPAVTNETASKFVVTALVYLVAQNFSQAVQNMLVTNKIDAFDRSIGDALRNSSHVQFLGTSSSANAYIAQRIAGANVVRNTIITANPEFISRSENEKIVADAYASVLKDRNLATWFDVVSDNVAGLDRYKHIAENMNPKSGKLHTRQMPHGGAHAHVNFIILEFSSGEREVYFGWLFSEEEGQAHVFSTRDIRLVNLFYQYFQSLYRCADPIDILGDYKDVRN